MRRRLVSGLAGGLAIVTVAGCLFRTAESPRFYRPSSTALNGANDEPRAPTRNSGAPIHLHSVRSAPFLRERIVWRASPVEYGIYEQRRWFELPSRYVRRALMTALQDTPGLRLDSGAKAARLDVEILAFDEVLAPAHLASVTLAVNLRAGTEERLDRLYTAEVSVPSMEGAAVAEAMGKALDEVVQKVAEGAAQALALKPATSKGRAAQ